MKNTLFAPLVPPSIGLVVLVGSLLGSSRAIAQSSAHDDTLPTLPRASERLNLEQRLNPERHPRPERSDVPVPNSILPSRSPSDFPVRSETYLLGAGDYVQVEVFNIPDYSGNLRVLSGGVINLPVAGPVAVAGLSLQQAAARVEETLIPFVRRPRVTLSLLAIRPLQVAIAGEVNRPGAYQIAVNRDQNESADVPTLTQAIELAGGITQLADIRQIEVQRQLATERTTSSQFQTISIDLWALLQEGDLDEDIRLQDGDRIHIPTAATLNPGETADIAAASFSPDQISVNVVGEVESPGTIAVPPNTPLNQAILAAGGFNNRARTGTVSLVRLNQNGTASQQEISVDFAQGISAESNPSLLPNDTIIVHRSGISQVGDTIDTILSPITNTFRVLRLFGL